MQVAVSKTSQPFKCLETQKESVILSQLSSLLPYGIEVNSFVVSEDVWSYKGMMIKSLHHGAMAEPAYRPGYIIVVDDACNVVCIASYQTLYNPMGNPVIRTELIGSTCNPALIKVNPPSTEPGTISISTPF